MKILRTTFIYIKFNMKILIIGGYGFLGFNLLKGFLEFNSYDIHILVKKTTLKRDNLFLKNYATHYVEDGINEIFFKHHNFDVIIDCSIKYGKVEEDIAEVYKTNFIFPLEIIEFSKLNTKFFICFDSYFSKEKYSSYRYLQDYTNSKKQLLKSLNNISSDIKILFLRLEHLYGPHDSNHKFVKSIHSALSTNKVELDLTECNQKRDFVHVFDVIDLLDLCIKRQSEFNYGINLFEVGTGNPISLRDFILESHKFNKSKTKLNFGKISKRENEILESYSDLKINIKMNWNPKIDFTKGVQLLN